MSELAFIFSLLMVGITAVGLYRKLNPQGLLMLSGLLMLTAAFFMQVHSVVPSKATGMVVFDLVRMIEEVFLSNLARAGFMIMTIGGYVAFMNNIKATNALVYISMKPLGLFLTLSLFAGYYSYSYWTITFYYYSFSCRIRIVACGFGLSCFN